MRKIVRTQDAPKPRGVYSPAIVADGFVFVSGQVSVNPKTNELELGDIRSETRRTLRDIVRIGVFLADLNDFDAMNEVFREFFPEDPPARTTVGAQLPKIKIEIDCIARVRESHLKRR